MDLQALSYTKIEGRHGSHEIVVYALSTCGHCRRALTFLDSKGLSYKYLYVDLIPLETKNAIKAELRSLFNENVAFPFAIIDGREHLVGFIEADWILTLGLGEQA